MQKLTKRERYYKSALKCKYGLTLEKYNAMISDQGNSCGICRKPLSPPPNRNVCVDHCHVTSVVRGILCQSCNSMIGCAKDSPEILLAAANYLERIINEPS
ncbi:endonuclease VII domain-containing protein (plasmid) [Skermanella rosea]|uniref:endonuclease VII domain-containing protein n=1 Tax=Skermanella rosea TaxID=1817965 RepID=UPI001934A11D|nr:endonuclease VII domain-containing protein [Skermanella rosea]